MLKRMSDLFLFSIEPILQHSIQAQKHTSNTSSKKNYFNLYECIWSKLAYP